MRRETLANDGMGQMLFSKEEVLDNGVHPYLQGRYGDVRRFFLVFTFEGRVT